MMVDLNKSRGATLVEMLVAVSIVFLILYSATQLLISSFRHYREVDSAVQVHQLALTSMAKLERDLRDGNAGSYRVFTSPPGIVFGSPRQGNGGIAFDPDSLQPLWQKLVCYYLEPEGTRFLLIRKEEFLSSPTDVPPTIDGSKDTAHFQSSVSGGSSIARGVEELTLGGSDTLDILLRVTDVSHEGTSTEAAFSVEIETSVNFRN